MEVVFLIIGIVTGAALGYLGAKYLSKSRESDKVNSQSDLKAELKFKEQLAEDAMVKLDDIQKELITYRDKYNQLNQELAIQVARNETLDEKLKSQMKDIEELGTKFNTEFENIANKILETKSEKFTESNKKNMEALLTPLGQNIDKFKKKVEEVYDKESKERFSLGEKVKDILELNHILSEETRNLTKALKGESKTQGRWGEMILESILEKSGLVKDREYFVEHELKDDEGKALRSESEGKKMRPDVVIKYPDNRSVIIDSKVSLSAFARSFETEDPDIQKQELDEHVASIKRHVVALSTKGYDDYDKALDFVMMFIPSESAYIAALQIDADLWNYAYDKRILLLNPTNLITSLKLIVDLWKREYQNQNAIEIAERGAKLYNKFVGFVENLQGVGNYLAKAQDRYDDAYKQLSTGNDNLVLQSIKLRKLGLSTKKDLPANVVKDAIENEGIDELNDSSSISLDHTAEMGAKRIEQLGKGLEDSAEESTEENTEEELD